jgi:hypothetical protein
MSQEQSASNGAGNSGAASGAITPEQKRLATKMREFPDVKAFAPKTEMGKYYGQILFASKHYVVQQVGDNKAVAHERSAFEGLSAASVKAGKIIQIEYQDHKPSLTAADPARWVERQNRTPASPEMLALARDKIGPSVSVFNPPPKALGLSTQYDGPVVAVTDTKVIQGTSRNTAYAHDKADLGRAVGVGEALSVIYAAGKVEVKELAAPARAPARAPERESDAKKALDPEKEKRNDFFFARAIIQKQYGTEGQSPKIYDAGAVLKHQENGKGDFGGRIVATTDHHVIQRVGQNSFVCHDRKAIEGEIMRGQAIALKYEHGKATQTPLKDHVREQNRGQGQGR